MNVVIDSTALHEDFYLKSAAIEKLLIAAKKGGHSVFLPEVVVGEMKKHYRESLEVHQLTVKRELKEFERKAKDSLLNPITNELVEKKIRVYNKDIRKRIKDLGIEILPLPDVDHRTVLNRALETRKPFHKSGRKGYQDTLIWLTIIEKAEEFIGNSSIVSPRIIFVTDNHTDFCEPDTCDLHKDLISDLEDNDINTNVVKVVRKVNDAFKILFVNRSIQETKDIEQYLAGPKFGESDLLADIKKKMMDYFPGQEFLSEDVGFPDSYESPTVDMFHEDFVFEINSVEVLGKDEIGVNMDVSVTLLFDIFIHKSELAYFEPNEGPSVYDYNWNDHVAAAQKEKKVWFTIDLLLDGKLNQIKNFDIEINGERNQLPRGKFRSRDL